jgi:S1-C subfamily serine protease
MVLIVSKKLAAFGADKSPFEPGDVIWKVNGKRIGAELKFIDAVLQDGSGKDVSVEVYRNGAKQCFEVPVSELSTAPQFRLLSFAGTIFFGMPEELKVTSGKSSVGVFIANSEPSSPFFDITSQSFGNPMKNAFQITYLNGQKVSSLDDVEKAINKLLDKDRFVVRFMSISGDMQESSMVVKQVPEFMNASLYEFDHEEKKWNIKQIKK